MSWAEVKVLKDYIHDEVEGIYARANPEPVYGFIEHGAVLSPTSRIEYIGENKDYIPFSLNTTTGVMDYGSWADFPLLKSNVPCMVRSDGTKDYELDSNDYTKKLDGTESDVANTSYDGGAFAWLQKIYKCEYNVGTDRVVMFCMTKKNDSFKPVGFVDFNGKELDGVWLPMFYGSMVGEKLTSFATGYPDKNHTTEQQKAAIDAFSSRAVFLGGSIVETIIDLLLMWGKNADLQIAYGFGNMNGYDASDTTNYGMKENAVVNGGQFYGNQTKTSLNKILHSIVLGTYNQRQRDPYELIVSGRVKVSPNYVYDITGATYKDTGIDAPDIETAAWCYPNLYQTVDAYGSVPIDPYGGSTTTGGCDGVYIPTNISSLGVRVSLRFGYCSGGRGAGVRCRHWDCGAGGAFWRIGASPLLLPPAP